MTPVYHALVLNLHQPAGNLEELLDQRTWEATEILYALDRIPRALWPLEDVARVHLSLSGTLMETLCDPRFQERVYGIVKCGDLLWHLQNQKVIELLGTGYYHPVLPLIPPADRPLHIDRWLGQARHLFWRTRFQGFWPPEMGFCMEMIPLLKKAGYRYVIVDSENVEPVSPMGWDELRYCPHLAQHGGEEMVVIVRDRQLSDAQESGMDVDWFLAEVEARTQSCDRPPLITTCSDGDNGGWFRNATEGGNFWGVFYEPLIERIREGTTRMRPCFIHEYLDEFGVHGEVRVKTAAWNTGWHNGIDFTQWTGSESQRAALQRVYEVSRQLHELRAQTEEARLEDAVWRLLRAETSCNFYWGEEWVPRCHADLDEALRHLESCRADAGGERAHP